VSLRDLDEGSKLAPISHIISSELFGIDKSSREKSSKKKGGSHVLRPLELPPRRKDSSPNSLSWSEEAMNKLLKESEAIAQEEEEQSKKKSPRSPREMANTLTQLLSTVRKKKGKREDDKDNAGHHIDPLLKEVSNPNLSSKGEMPFLKCKSEGMIKKVDANMLRSVSERNVHESENATENENEKKKKKKKKKEKEKEKEKKRKRKRKTRDMRRQKERRRKKRKLIEKVLVVLRNFLKK
jgi:hypothetical protein